MTRPDRFTIFPADTARRAHAREPEQEAPDFRPGDLPESLPVEPPSPDTPIRDPFDCRERAASWERPIGERWAS